MASFLDELAAEANLTVAKYEPPAVKQSMGSPMGHWRKCRAAGHVYYVGEASGLEEEEVGCPECGTE